MRSLQVQRCGLLELYLVTAYYMLSGKLPYYSRKLIILMFTLCPMGDRAKEDAIIAEIMLTF